MKVVLVAILLTGLCAVIVGLGLADYANSPRNRTGNDFADIGVAMGVGIAIVGGVLTLLSSLGLLIRARRER